MKLNVDFARTVQIYNQVMASDIISEIGGLKSAIDPMFGLAVPLLILYWLVGFARIIQIQQKENYRQILMKMINYHLGELEKNKENVPNYDKTIKERVEGEIKNQNEMYDDKIHLKNKKLLDGHIQDLNALLEEIFHERLKKKEPIKENKEPDLSKIVEEAEFTNMPSIESETGIL